MKHIQWMDYSQTKHKVRQITSRSECSMSASAAEAFNITGGAEAAQGFRVGLLSKLSPSQRLFVADQQSMEEQEEEEEKYLQKHPDPVEPDGESRPDFEGVSAAKMAAALSRTRHQHKAISDARPASSPASDSNSHTQRTLAMVSAKSPAMSPEASPPMSAPHSRRPSSQTSRRPSSVTIEEASTANDSKDPTLSSMPKTMPKLPLPDVEIRGSMRSKSNLAIMESSSGNMSRPQTSGESRKSSTLSSSSLSKGKRSRSNISVTVCEPEEEDGKVA